MTDGSKLPPIRGTMKITVDPNTIPGMRFATPPKPNDANVIQPITVELNMIEKRLLSRIAEANGFPRARDLARQIIGQWLADRGHIELEKDED